MVRKALAIIVFDDRRVVAYSGVKLGDKIDIDLGEDFSKLFEVKMQRYGSLENLLTHVSTYFNSVFGYDIWNSWLFRHTEDEKGERYSKIYKNSDKDVGRMSQKVG